MSEKRFRPGRVVRYLQMSAARFGGFAVGMLRHAKKKKIRAPCEADARGRMVVALAEWGSKLLYGLGDTQDIFFCFTISGACRRRNRRGGLAPIPEVTRRRRLVLRRFGCPPSSSAALSKNNFGR